MANLFQRTSYSYYGSTWANALQPYGPCKDGFYWATRQQNYALAWASADRGDWMLWLAGVLITAPAGDATRQTLVKAMLACLNLVPATILNSSAMVAAGVPSAITTITSWANGAGATLGQVQALLPAYVSAASRLGNVYEPVDACPACATAVCALAAYQLNVLHADYPAFVAATYGGSPQSRRDVLANCANQIRVVYPTAPTLPNSNIPPPVQHYTLPNNLTPISGGY